MAARVKYSAVLVSSHQPAYKSRRDPTELALRSSHVYCNTKGFYVTVVKGPYVFLSNTHVTWGLSRAPRALYVSDKNELQQCRTDRKGALPLYCAAQTHE